MSDNETAAAKDPAKARFFALVLIRRDEVGCAELVAELPEDIAQLERAARKLVG